MKKKMVNRLCIPFVHTTPINQNYVLLQEIVHGKDISYDRRPKKKAILNGTLVRQTFFQWKWKPSLQPMKL
jgi:hypothetical protein